MRVVVAGGTGTVGTLVVARLASRGHEPVVLARSTGCDLRSGDGLAGAMAGAAATIDTTNVAALRRGPATQFFRAATGALLAAGAAAGVAHHVVLSIVGVDRVDWGYYQAKLVQEQLALDGPLPATVLRTTQFHEFAAQMLARGTPVVAVPRMLCQPVAAAEVADALVEAALGPPQGLAAELAGPDRHQMGDMVRALARRRGDRRRILSLALPGAAGRGMADGGLLPTGPGPRGLVTFEQWLAETPQA